MAEERPLTDASPSEIIRAHFDMVYRLALSQTRSVPNAECRRYFFVLFKNVRALNLTSI